MRWDLARSSEISLDLDEISLDLLDKLPKYENLLPESGNLKSESGNLRPKSEKSHRNLENLVGFWKILPDSRNFYRILEFFCLKFLVHRSNRVFSGFGRKIEIDPPESVFGTNDPPPTGDLIKSAGFRVRIFGWVGSSDWMDSPTSMLKLNIGWFLGE